MHRKYLLSSLVIASLCYQANAQQYQNPEVVLSLGKYCHVLDDQENSLTAEKALTSSEFVAQINDVPNFGSSNSTFWVKFSITNHTDRQKLMLRLAKPFLNEVLLYQISDSKPTLLGRSGDLMKFSDKQNGFQDHVFGLNIPDGKERQFMLKIKSFEQVILPLYLGSEQAVLISIMQKDSFFAIYFGIMLLMFLYNLFIWFSSKDKSYLYYVIYILAVVISQASLEGYGGRYLWGNWPVLNDFMVYLFSILVGIMAMLFIQNFLKTKEEAPRLNKGLNLLILLYLLVLALCLAGQKSTSYKLILLLAGLSAFYSLITAGYLILKKNSRPAKFFAYAWTLFIICVIVYVLKDAGVLPYNLFTVNSLQLGSGVEVIVLSIALADKINTSQKATIEAQTEAFDAVKENERMIIEQNVILEEKVKIRTSDLEQAQTRLVNSEKMATLGQLTAGIAHEINNPINFVSSNVKPLKRDIDQITGLLKKYLAVTSGPEVSAQLEALSAEAKKLGTNYVIEEMGMLIQGIDDGANRTKEIVKGLRSFSRLDETDLKLANLNECVESTIVILRNGIKEKNINILFNPGDIMSIECFQGKLNQVIMNVLNNSIQAIEANDLPEGEGLIEINTWEADGKIILCIKDNGIGMSNEVRLKMFDPFFTTKSIGEGTGLGLSIVYTILQNHKAETTVESNIGGGTSFRIGIPMNLQSLLADNK